MFIDNTTNNAETYTYNNNTVVAAYAAEYGLEVSEEIILTLVSVGVALILGIAHEDSGQKQFEGMK